MQKHTRSNSDRFSHRLAAIVTSFAAICVLSSSVYAQDVDEEENSADEEAVLDEIIVVGSFAGSLIAAMEMKKNSESVIEAISLTDLGQLPDVNIADAMKRLPGVAAVRDPNNGAASNIQLRGMPAELTLGTLNGRDLATQSPSRNIRYDQFPSELIGGAVVYKSTQASINDGGVAGVVDLYTIRPLDYEKSRLSFDAAYMTDTLASDISRSDSGGFRGSATYVYQSDDETFGFAVGWAHRDEPVAVMRTQHQSHDPSSAYADLDGDGTFDSAAWGLNHFTRAGEDKRDGAFAVFQWEPGDSFNLYVDALYSQVDVNNDINGFDVRNVNQVWGNVYTDAVAIDNRLVSGTISGLTDAWFYPLYSDYALSLQNTAAFTDRDDNLQSLGAKAEWQLSDESSLVADVAISKADYLARYASIGTEPLDLSGAVPLAMAGQSLTFDATFNLPKMVMNVDLTDPDINRVYSLNAPFYEDGTDDILTYKLDYLRDIEWGVLDRFTAGIRFVDRDKVNDQLSQSGWIAMGDRTPLTPDMILPDAHGSYSGSQQNIPAFLTFDFFAAADAYFGGYNPTSGPSDQVASWKVNEKTTAAYIQMEFSGGDRVSYSGNIGIRYVDTSATSSSARLAGTDVETIIEPFSVKNDYQEWLPSFTLNLRPTDEWVIRFGLGKTIARAPVDDLNAGFEAYSWFGAPWQAFGGNPYLEPFRADQLDLSAEYYYGENAYFSVAAYYKDLDTYITTSTEIVEIDGVEYEFFRPVNEKGGYIQGVELTLSHQFTSLPAPFDGLGIWANVAFVDSDIEVSRNYSDSTLGLLGQSDYVYTLSAYYSLGGLDANISYSARDEFSHVVDGGAFETTDSEGYLIGQVSYQVNDNWSVFLKGLNLTNQTYETFLGNGNRNIRGRYEEFGRTYYAGVKASF